jgi:RNA polymerase sigma factor (sigma-70 family)
MTAYSTDLNLVLATNNGDTQAAGKLFMKFQGLIHSLSMSCSGETEDFVQDAYFSMMQAASKVDIARIRYPESWGFYEMFKSYLMNQSCKTRTQYNREQKRISDNGSMYLEENLHGTGADENAPVGAESSISNSALMRYNPEVVFLETTLEDSYVRFMRSCTEEEKLVLSRRRAGKLIREIAEELGRSKSYVQDVVVSMKRRASSVFGVKYQYS